MNRKQLIMAMVEKSQISKENNEKVLDAIIEVIKEELATGGKVKLLGFGTFEREQRGKGVIHRLEWKLNYLRRVVQSLGQESNSKRHLGNEKGEKQYNVCRKDSIMQTDIRHSHTARRQWRISRSKNVMS